MSRVPRATAVVAPSPGLSALLSIKAIRIGASARDWRAAVRLAGDALVASGATAPAYTDEMIATVEELGPYIVIAPGIALAHSRPSEAVHRAGISLVVLNEPVNFGHRQNDPVRLVVGLAAPDEEGHVTALGTLAEFLADDGRRDELLRSTGPDDLLRLVEAFEGDQASQMRRSTSDGKDLVDHI
jgi:PTS system ascorbate-specific IIA component